MSLVDLGKRLLDAAKKGDTDAVRALMSNGAPFTTDWLGTSPLHFATQCGHQHTVEVLLRAGISRDARTKVDRTPLHVAAQEGHVGIVELLIANAADIDAKDMLKMTPLHWATEKGHTAIIEVLLRNGADVNCENKFDRTPLDIALANGRLDLAQMLRSGQSSAILPLPLSNPDEIVTIETTEATEIVSTTEQLEDQVNGTGETDQSSTSVLATLAALAEASGPINSQTVSNAETMNWLESHGITMISTTDGSIITSAVDSGQTISLTEAGKIALDIIQQQDLENTGNTTTTATDDTTTSTTSETITQIESEDGDPQKIITIVTNPDTEEEDPEEGTMTVVDAEELQNLHVLQHSHEDTNDGEPPLKQIKTEVIEEINEFPTDNILQDDSEQIIQENTGIEQSEESGDVHDELKKQLEAVQKQAKAFEEKLRKKEEEAEIYKKQLSVHIKTE